MNKKKPKRKEKLKIKQKQSQKQKQIVNVHINPLKPKMIGRKMAKRIVSSPQFIFRVNEPPQPNFNTAPTVAATPLLNAVALQQQNASTFQPIRNPLAPMRMYPPPPIGKIPSYALRINNPTTNLDSLASLERSQEDFFNSNEGAGGQQLSNLKNVKMEPQSSPHVKFNNNITNTPANTNEDEDYDFFFTPKNDENPNNNFVNSSTPPSFSPIPNALMERRHPTNGRTQIFNQDTNRWVFADLPIGQNLQMNNIAYNNSIAKNKIKKSPKPFKI